MATAIQILSDSQLADYHRDGYVLVRKLFDTDEMRILLDFARQDPALQQAAYARKDAQGNETKLALWNEAGESLYSMFSRSPRLVDAAEQLLAGEVYHWHTKMMFKEPFVGGAWEWHQDYGYWYNFGCLYPWLVSCLIAVDRASQENGCLQVLKGSHHLGRIDHGKSGEQTGADMERVEAALKQMDLVYVEADPGDVLFFHSNLLHRSDKNTSAHSRWSLICCYNAAANSPYKPSRHPAYSPLARVADSAIKDWSNRS